MANRRTKVRHPAGAYRWSDKGVLAEVEKLLQRTPQFRSLTSVSADREDRLTESQQKFIDDFAAEVRRGVQGSEDGSVAKSGGCVKGLRDLPRGDEA